MTTDPQDQSAKNAHYSQDQDSLREKILFASEVTYAPYTKDDYKTEQIVKLPLKDLMSLISQDRAALLERVEREFNLLRPQDNVTFTREYASEALNKIKEEI